MTTAPQRTVDFKGDADASVVEQEPDGRRSLTTNETLPTQMGSNGRAVLEGAGVVFGDIVEEDPLFTHVTLPAGWKKVATCYSLWSNLLDDKGRKRASMCYKDAFFDREAFLNVKCRFDIENDYPFTRAHSAVRYVVLDAGRVVFSTKPHPFDVEYSDNWRAAKTAACQEAQDWLEKFFPNWKDPSAYWD